MDGKPRTRLRTLSKQCREAREDWLRRSSVLQGMNAPLPPHRRRPVPPLQTVHSAGQPGPLQLQLLHEFSHCNILLWIYSAIRLMVEEIHQDLQGAASFILRGRRCGRGCVAGGAYARGYAGAGSRVGWGGHGFGAVTLCWRIRLLRSLLLHCRVDDQSWLFHLFYGGL